MIISKRSRLTFKRSTTLAPHLLKNKRISLRSTYEPKINALSHEIESCKGNMSKIKFLFQNESAFDVILYILSLQQKRQNELYLLQNYLATLDKLVFLLSTNSLNLDQILLNISFHLQTEKVNRGNIIYKYGDKGHKYYILLKGGVSLLMPKELKIRMNIVDYLKLLIRLYITQEHELLIKTITSNKRIYDINLNDIMSYVIPFIVDKNKNEQQFMMNPIQKVNILNMITKEEHDMLKVYMSIVQKEYKSFKFHLSKRNQEKIPTINDYITLTFHTPTLSKENDHLVNVFKYNEVNKLNHGEAFGEIGLQSTNAKRSASVMAFEDTFLGILTRENYNSSIKDITTKIRRNNMKFLLTFKLFSGLNWNFLDHKLYNHFTIKKLRRNDILINQYQHFADLYFIKTGEFEITTKMSVDDIKQFAKKLIPTLHFPIPQSGDTSSKEMRKISIIKDNDIVGFIDMIGIDGNSAFTIRCISHEGCLLCIERKLIETLAHKFPEIKKQYKQISTMKCLMMFNRLSSVCSINVKEDLTKTFTKKMVTLPLNKKRAVTSIKRIEIKEQNEYGINSTIITNNSNKKGRFSLMKIKNCTLSPNSKMSRNNRNRSDSNSGKRKKIFKLNNKEISSFQLTDDSGSSLYYHDGNNSSRYKQNKENKKYSSFNNNKILKTHIRNLTFSNRNNILYKIEKKHKEQEYFLNKILSYGYPNRTKHLSLLNEPFKTCYSNSSFENYILNYDDNDNKSRNNYINPTEGNYYINTLSSCSPRKPKNPNIQKQIHVCNNVYI